MRYIVCGIVESVGPARSPETKEQPQVDPNPRRVRARIFLAAALLLAWGCSQTGSPQEEPPSGAAVFADHCAICHSLPLMTFLQ